MIGASALAAVIVLAVGLPAQGAALNGDPADGPPPPLDTLPIEPAEEEPPSRAQADGPRPIEEPEDAPQAPTKKRRTLDDPDAGDAPGDAAGANEDWLMLGIDYLIIFVPVIGGPLIAPLAQGLTHKLGGEVLVQNEYPNWWMGTLAGYGVFALSGTAIVGGYLLAVVGSIALASSSPQAAIGAAVGGLAIMAAGAALIFVEPAVVYFFARSGAKPAPGARAKRLGLGGDPDEDDETPESPIGLFGSSAPLTAPAWP